MWGTESQKKRTGGIRLEVTVAMTPPITTPPGTAAGGKTHRYSDVRKHPSNMATFVHCSSHQRSEELHETV